MSTQATPCAASRSTGCRRICGSTPGPDTGVSCRKGVEWTIADTCFAWCLMVHGGMQPFIVVVVDVGEHLAAHLGAGGEDAGVDLGLEAGEERLGDGVVEA